MVVWWIRSAERLWTRAFCTQHHTLEHGHNDTSGGAAAQGHERRRLPAGGARQSEGLVELTSLSASNAARIAARGHHQVARHAACQAARHAAARRTTKRTRARRLVAGGAHGVSSHASIASVTSASRASTKHRARTRAAGALPTGTPPLPTGTSAREARRKRRRSHAPPRAWLPRSPRSNPRTRCLLALRCANSKSDVCTRDRGFVELFGGRARRRGDRKLLRLALRLRIRHARRQECAARERGERERAASTPFAIAPARAQKVGGVGTIVGTDGTPLAQHHGRVS